MSDWDDLYGVRQPLISDELAEGILSGSCSAPDADSDGLDLIVRALRTPADPSELSGLDAAVAAFQGAVVSPFAGPSTPRTRLMRKKLLKAKTIAAIGAITLVSAGAAAAATGTVPSPFASDTAREVTAERVPEVALVNVGKHLEDTSTVTETTLAAAVDAVDQDAADDTAALEGTGPDATGPAKFGLCTAYAAHVEHRDATEPEDGDVTDGDPTAADDLPAPFRNLTEAATAAGQSVEEFCADAAPGQSESAPGLTGESPSATAPGQSGESPSATAPGRTGEHPSKAPASGEQDNPSVTAPGRP